MSFDFRQISLIPSSLLKTDIWSLTSRLTSHCELWIHFEDVLFLLRLLFGTRALVRYRVIIRNMQSTFIVVGWPSGLRLPKRLTLKSAEGRFEPG
jgi:hypothetical protein